MIEINCNDIGCYQRHWQELSKVLWWADGGGQSVFWLLSSCRARTGSRSKAQGRQHSRTVRRDTAASGGRQAWGTACSWRPPSPCRSWCRRPPGWTGLRRSEPGRLRSRRRCRTRHRWCWSGLSAPARKAVSTELLYREVSSYLAPVHLEQLWLGVAGGLDLLVLPVLHAVPQTHPARVEQAGDQHQDGRGRDVGRRGLPAASDPRGEGDEHEEESNNEEGNHCSHHIWR